MNDWLDILAKVSLAFTAVSAVIRSTSVLEIKESRKNQGSFGPP